MVLNAAGWEVARDASWREIGVFTQLAWSPDGSRLAYSARGADGTELRVLDLDRRGRVA